MKSDSLSEKGQEFHKNLLKMATDHVYSAPVAERDDLTQEMRSSLIYLLSTCFVLERQKDLANKKPHYRTAQDFFAFYCDLLLANINIALENGIEGKKEREFAKSRGLS